MAGHVFGSGILDKEGPCVPPPQADSIKEDVPALKVELAKVIAAKEEASKRENYDEGWSGGGGGAMLVRNGWTPPWDHPNLLFWVGPPNTEPR